MKKIEGRYKIAFVILVLYIGLMIYLFGAKIFSPKPKTYLLIGSTAQWKFDGSSWKNIESDEKDLYAWKNYDVFVDRKKFGNYKVTFSEKKWYLFENNRTPVNYQGDFLGIRSNRPYKVADFETEEVTTQDLPYIEKVLEDNGLKTNQSYTDSYKAVYDIDSDGKEETIYVISNMFPLDFAPSNVFNFVFVVDNGKIRMVYKTIDAFTNMYNHCKIRLHYLVDTDDNGKYEIILNCNYYSTQGTCTTMYEKKGSKYERIKSCNS